MILWLAELWATFEYKANNSVKRLSSSICAFVFVFPPSGRDILKEATQSGSSEKESESGEICTEVLQSTVPFIQCTVTGIYFLFCSRVLSKEVFNSFAVTLLKILQVPFLSCFKIWHELAADECEGSLNKSYKTLNIVLKSFFFLCHYKYLISIEKTTHLSILYSSFWLFCFSFFFLPRWCFHENTEKKDSTEVKIQETSSLKCSFK